MSELKVAPPVTGQKAVDVLKSAGVLTEDGKLHSDYQCGYVQKEHNLLIKDIAERATKEMDQEAFSEDMNIPPEWYEKFAELIVKECLMLVYERYQKAPTDDDGYFKSALDMVYDDIEHHFGVNE